MFFVTHNLRANIVIIIRKTKYIFAVLANYPNHLVLLDNYSNKFGISLTFLYLCRQITKNYN